MIENRPRYRLRLEYGRLAVMAASDLGLGVAGVKTYAAGPDGAKFVVTLFHAVRHDVLAVIEADQLGRLRTGAACGVAAKYLRKGGRGEPRRDRLRAAGGDAGRRGAGGAARDLVDRRLLSRLRSAARHSPTAWEPSRQRATRRRLLRTSSSRSRRRRTPCCAASGYDPARSCALRARTCRATASWTTRCSSGPRSSAATRWRTPSSSPGPHRAGRSGGARLAGSARAGRGRRRRGAGSSIGRRHRRLQVQRHRGLGRRCRRGCRRRSRASSGSASSSRALAAGRRRAGRALAT